MKAIQIHAYGGPEVLELADVPDPKPGPGEVLVQIVAAGVNPVDWKVRSGEMAQVMPVRFPYIPGSDVSGNVVEAGEGVTGFKAHDRVFGMLNGGGAYAGLVVAKAELLRHLPDGLDPVDAAAYPMVSLTGAELIGEGLGARSGQRILVTGALGSVGRAAVFAAKQLGAEVVAGVRPSERDEAAELGAAAVVALDDEEDLRRSGLFDAVADTIGQAVASKLLSFIKPGGVLATVVPPPPQAEGIVVKPLSCHPDGELLDRMGRAAAEGRFALPIAREFQISEVREAHTLGEKGAKGKILLLP